jgi:hypothetical protein
LFAPIHSHQADQFQEHFVDVCGYLFFAGVDCSEGGRLYICQVGMQAFIPLCPQLSPDCCVEVNYLISEGGVGDVNAILLCTPQFPILLDLLANYFTDLLEGQISVKE